MGIYISFKGGDGMSSSRFDPPEFQNDRPGALPDGQDATGDDFRWEADLSSPPVFRANAAPEDAEDGFFTIQDELPAPSRFTPVEHTEQSIPPSKTRNLLARLCGVLALAFLFLALPVQVVFSAATQEKTYIQALEGLSEQAFSEIKENLVLPNLDTWFLDEPTLLNASDYTLKLAVVNAVSKDMVLDLVRDNLPQILESLRRDTGTTPTLVTEPFSRALFEELTRRGVVSTWGLSPGYLRVMISDEQLEDMLAEQRGSLAQVSVWLIALWIVCALLIVVFFVLRLPREKALGFFAAGLAILSLLWVMLSMMGSVLPVSAGPVSLLIQVLSQRIFSVSLLTLTGACLFGMLLVFLSRIRKGRTEVG